MTLRLSELTKAIRLGVFMWSQPWFDSFSYGRWNDRLIVRHPPQMFVTAL